MTWVSRCGFIFFFNDTATTEIYTLSLHDALPISSSDLDEVPLSARSFANISYLAPFTAPVEPSDPTRSEEHTSELQSRLHLVCRLLLETKYGARTAV